MHADFGRRIAESQGCPYQHRIVTAVPGHPEALGFGDGPAGWGADEHAAVLTAGASTADRQHGVSVVPAAVEDLGGALPDMHICRDEPGVIAVTRNSEQLDALRRDFDVE